MRWGGIFGVDDHDRFAILSGSVLWWNICIAREGEGGEMYDVEDGRPREETDPGPSVDDHSLSVTLATLNDAEMEG